MRSAILLALPLITLLIQPAVLGGIVVCVAPGGHVEIELAGEDCCGDSGVDSCSTCHDFTVGTDPIAPPASKESGDGTVGRDATAPRIVPSADGPNFVRDVERFTPHLVHLRSIRLLR